jgi:hypothetical protein
MGEEMVVVDVDVRRSDGWDKDQMQNPEVCLLQMYSDKSNTGEKVCVYVWYMTRGCVRPRRCAWSRIARTSPLLLKARVVRGPHAQIGRVVVILLWCVDYIRLPLSPLSPSSPFTPLLRFFSPFSQKPGPFVGIFSQIVDLFILVIFIMAGLWAKIKERWYEYSMPWGAFCDAAKCECWPLFLPLQKIVIVRMAISIKDTPDVS